MRPVHPRSARRITLQRRAIALLLAFLFALAGCGDQGEKGDPGDPGPEGPQGPAGDLSDSGTSVEACLGCHGPGGVSPVVDIEDPGDAHYVDTDADGPATASGYRQLEIEILSVDVTSDVVVIVFHLTDENDTDVDDVFASDGRFGLARLLAPAGQGDANAWETLISSERFTTGAGDFVSQGSGRYQYTSAYDPQSPPSPVVAGDTLRLAVQISASDIPPGNGVCNFDASLSAPNDCTSPVTRTRDIVSTAQCNSCHGVTSDTHLSYHGGARTDVDYCVVCHNPGLGQSDMTQMVHRIHYGAELEPEEPPYRWEHVNYTRDIADCTTCHANGGVDEANWNQVPTRDACGACHDTVNFDTGEGHGSGGVQADNSLCVNCHPPADNLTGAQLPVQMVHRGVERNLRAADYRGPGNGFAIESLIWDSEADSLVVQFSVTQAGEKLDLETAPEFPGGGGTGRVNLKVGWATSDYTNEGSGSSSPAQPPSYSGLDFAEVSNVGGNVFERVIAVPSGAFDTLSVSMEGYPAMDLDDNRDGIANDAFDDAAPIRSVVAFANVEPRGMEQPRRTVIDMDRCNECHDAAGAGLSLHGNNRTDEMQACSVCHNADATDIGQRPADPADAIDGKREEAVDMKRMVHQIHAGKDLDPGIVVYGFRGTPHDYSHVGFIGNLANCETCHTDANAPDSSYGAEAAWETLATTLDTGDDVEDPSDDLNVSPVTSVCSSCHDDQVARAHMLLNGASFIALDEDIH